MPLRDPVEYRALVSALGGPGPAGQRLRKPAAWVKATLGDPPLWALLILRRARHEALAPPPGALARETAPVPPWRHPAASSPEAQVMASAG
jgi:hypothetical protein